MAKQQKTNGRPKMSALDKAKSRAARDYRNYLRTFTAEFEVEVARKSVQFYSSDAAMGRPPLTLKQHQEKARRQWDASWAQYVEQCERDGVEPESPKQLEKFKAKDKAGRRGHDRVIYLLKYIRQQQRKADDAEQTPDEEYEKAQQQTRGRIPMTKLEKVQHYREKAELARQEVLEIVANLPRSEQLYYKIHDLKVDRRQALMCINQPDNPQAIALGLSAEQAREKIKELDTRIGALETERDEALKKEKPKKKRGRPRKLTPNEESEKARQLLQDAFDEAEPDEGELEDLRQKSDRLDRLIKEAKEQQLQKKIEEQERELRELGIDPDKVVNG
jgi:hypothetical protein